MHLRDRDGGIDAEAAPLHPHAAAAHHHRDRLLACPAFLRRRRWFELVAAGGLLLLVLYILCALVNEYNNPWIRWRHEREWPNTTEGHIMSQFGTRAASHPPIAFPPLTRAAREATLNAAPALPYLDMLVVTPTVFSWTHRRTLVRTQWARSVQLYREVNHLAEKAEVPIKYLFVIGRTSLTPAQLIQADLEQKAHGDLLLLDAPDIDGSDGYGTTLVSATTLKMLMSLRWAVQHYRFKDLVRGGDDAYFNPVEWTRVRPTLPQERMLFGRFLYHAPVRERKLQLYFRSHTWPPFPLGMGYIMTYDLVLHLATSEMPLVTSTPEDAVVGMWISGLQLNLVDDPRFHNINSAPERWSLTPCLPTDLLVHYMEDDDWNHIDNRGRLSC